MLILSILTGLSFILLLIQIFYQYKIQLDAGLLIGFFLFFDIYGFILSKIFPFISPLFFILIIAFFAITLSFFRFPESFLIALKQKEFLLSYLFFGFILVSYLWTPNPKYGIYKFQILLIKAIIPGTAIYFSLITFRRLNWIPVILSGILYVVIFLLFQQDSAYTTHRMTLEGANPIWIARAILLLASISFFALQWSLPAKLVVIIPTLITAFFAQSKGPFLAIFIAFLAYIFIKYSNRLPQKKLILWLIIKIILVMVLFITLFSIFLEQTNLLKGSRFAVLFSVKQLFADPTFLDRVVKYGNAIKIFFRHIFLGAGIGGFAVIDERHYPHNIILEIASEYGIIGLSIWLYYIKHIFILAKPSTFLFFIFTQALAYTLFSGDLGSNNEYILISFIIIAIQNTQPRTTI